MLTLFLFALFVFSKKHTKHNNNNDDDEDDNIVEYNRQQDKRTASPAETARLCYVSEFAPQLCQPKIINVSRID